MVFKQLLIRKDERRLDNSLSAFICVHLRLKNKLNDLHHPQLSAPICVLKPSHSVNLRLNFFPMIKDYARRIVDILSAFICVHPRLKNKRSALYPPQSSAPICVLKPKFRS